MAGFLLVPVVVLLVAAGGYGICLALGFDPYVRAMWMAGIGSIIASELALVPLLLSRGAKQDSVSQAGLLATLAHMFGNVVVASIVILGKLMPGMAFIYWMLAMYLATLIIVTGASTQAVRKAPTANQE